METEDYDKGWSEGFREGCLAKDSVIRELAAEIDRLNQARFNSAAEILARDGEIERLTLRLETAWALEPGRFDAQKVSENDTLREQNRAAATRAEQKE